jgi:hypothetical protein
MDLELKTIAITAIIAVLCFSCDKIDDREKISKHQQIYTSVFVTSMEIGRSHRNMGMLSIRFMMNADPLFLPMGSAYFLPAIE